MEDRCLVWFCLWINRSLMQYKQSISKCGLINANMLSTFMEKTMCRKQKWVSCRFNLLMLAKRFHFMHLIRGYQQTSIHTCCCHVSIALMKNLFMKDLDLFFFYLIMSIISHVLQLLHVKFFERDRSRVSDLRQSFCYTISPFFYEMCDFICCGKNTVLN